MGLDPLVLSLARLRMMGIHQDYTEHYTQSLRFATCPACVLAQILAEVTVVVGRACK
jgi:hypothetical protein